MGADFAKELLHESGKLNYQINKYKGIGHLVDIPYFPPRTVAHISYFPKPIEVLMGGEDIFAHTAGQIELWDDTLKFLRGGSRFKIANDEMSNMLYLMSKI